MQCKASLTDNIINNGIVFINSQIIRLLKTNRFEKDFIRIQINKELDNENWVEKRKKWNGPVKHRILSNPEGISQ